MKTSQKGIDLIKSFEGFRSCAYLCPANVWTIGYGHTGPDVSEGLKISQDEAIELLVMDLEFSEATVTELIDRPLTQNQFDALVSFVFNVGRTNFSRSTLRKRLNAGDVKGAAAEFLKWTIANHKIVPGLVRRREAERNLFLS